MTGLELCYIICLAYSSVLQGSSAFTRVECFIYEVSLEDHDETPVEFDHRSPQFEAFISSVEFKNLLDNLDTLTSIPNFPYLTNDEVIVLSNVAKKLRLLEKEEDCTVYYNDDYVDSGLFQALNE